MPLRRITFDIETAGDFRQGDWSGVELSVLGLHDSADNSFHAFYLDELKDAWPYFECADMIVGYNSEHFDIPILNKYYPGDLSKIKHVDLLKEVKEVLGRRLKLDNLAEATLGRKKTGDGLESLEWWKQGLKEKVRDYCLSDVALTNDLYEYARKHGSLKYRDYDGVREIKLSTALWEEPSPVAMTHALPF